METQKSDFRILQFTGENFKRLKVVNITPDANSVILAGENEQGKSSILDAIHAALAGKDSLKDIPQPIRHGEEKATITVDLGEYIITRSFTQNDSYLKVTSREGANYKNPQTILNGLFNKHTIDPSVFLTLDDKKQFETLRSIVKINVDLDKLESNRKEKYEERATANKEVQSLQARFDAKSHPEEGLPEEELSASDILKEIQDANEIITNNKTSRTNLAQIGTDFKSLKEEKIKLTELIKNLNDDLSVIDEGLINYQTYGKELQEVITSLVDPDLTALNAKLSNVEITNKKVRDSNEYYNLEELLISWKQTAEKLTTEIDDIVEQKQKALEEAEFPIEGLGFSDDGITFKNIPFSQCSQEERIKVALAIAMAQNPRLKVIFVRAASFFDDKNFALIQKLAKARGYQVWYEVIKTDQESGIIIEDGSIKHTETKVTDKEPVKVEKKASTKSAKKSEPINSMFE
ncbi:MAG TPA: AAA family ATPase [Ignavibacteriaceae bacterium]|nr:AAA family ATPase [Ignavibacteriaceae bacterium]